MSRVRGKNTSPELIVRRLLHKLGYRYRLHAKALPGKPDIVFSSRRKIVLVHGCFWHGHDCRWGRTPRSNVAFWTEKANANRRRDMSTTDQLRVAGWDVLVVWQCETKDVDNLLSRLTVFLKEPHKSDRQTEILPYNFDSPVGGG